MFVLLFINCPLLEKCSFPAFSLVLKQVPQQDDGFCFCFMYIVILSGIYIVKLLSMEGFNECLNY